MLKFLVYSIWIHSNNNKPADDTFNIRISLRNSKILAFKQSLG